MSLSQDARALLERYRAEPYDLEPLGHYQRWAMSFFMQPANLLNPHVDTTLQLDVTRARELYEREFAGVPGASFSAFLTWRLLATLTDHPAFGLRCIDGSWYLLRNPGLYIPVAVGGRERFCDVLLEDVVGLDWTSFVDRYRAGIDAARSGRFTPVSDLQFALSTFIGSLPGLRFTGLTLHAVHHGTTKPFFYFGQRYALGDRLQVPFAVKLHHSTGDLYVLDLMVQDFTNRLNA